MSFITILGENLSNQKSLTSLGNKLVIAGALVQHAKYCTGYNGRGPAAGPEGIMLLQCNIWHVALVLGNN